MEQQYRDIEKKLEGYYRREGKELPLPRDTELRAMKEMAPAATRIRITARYLGKALAACLSLAIVVSAVVYLPGKLASGNPANGGVDGLGGTTEADKDDAPQTDTAIGTPLPETEIPNGNETVGDVLFDKESFKPMSMGSTMEGISEVSLVEYAVKGGHLSVILSFVNDTGKSLMMDADYGVQYYDGDVWQDCVTNEYFHGFYDSAYEILEGGLWKGNYVVSCFDVSRPGLYRVVKYLGFGTENYVWAEFELTEGFKADPDNGYVGGDEVTWADTAPTPAITDFDTEIPDTTEAVEPIPSVVVGSVETFFAEEELYMDPPNLWIDESTGHLMLALYAMNPREEAYIMNGPYWHLMIWKDGGWTNCPVGSMGGFDFPDVEIPIEGLKDWQLTCDLSEAYDLSEAGSYRFVKDAICAVEFDLTEGLPTVGSPVISDTTAAEETETPDTTDFAETKAPGTPPDVEDLPKADQSTVGQTVAVSLAGHSFYYVYNAETRVERLVTIEYKAMTSGTYCPYLTVYEVEFLGLDGLIKFCQMPFKAKVLATVRVSFLEGMYARNAGKGTSGLKEEEMLNIYTDYRENTNTVQYYVGVLETDVLDVLKGNWGEEISSAFNTSLSVYEKIFKRFGLTEYLDVFTPSDLGIDGDTEGDSVDTVPSVPETAPYDTEYPIPETSPAYDETEDVTVLLEYGANVADVKVLEPSLWIDGDELFIKVGFVNETGGNLYLSTYYDLQYWQDGEWVSTYGPGGPLAFLEMVMEIGDGETWVETYKLASDFDLSRPGNYRFVKTLDLLVEFRLPYGLELTGQGTDVYETLPPVLVEPDEMPGEIVDDRFKVITGNQNSIVPIWGMLSTTIVMEGDETDEIIHGDGFGVLGLLREHLAAGNIPELLYEGDVEIVFADEDMELSGVWLLKIDGESDGLDYEIEYTTLEALSELPAGRHYVGFWVTESQGQSKTTLEALFELVKE